MPSWQSIIVSRTSLTISGSSAEVGSSNSMTSGCMQSARAIATRCCCPPESWAGYLCGLLGDADLSPDIRTRGRLGIALATCEGSRSARAVQVPQDGHVREQVEVLKDHADLEPDLFKPAPVVQHFEPGDGDAARLVVLKAD